MLTVSPVRTSAAAGRASLADPPVAGCEIVEQRLRIGRQVETRVVPAADGELSCD